MHKQPKPAGPPRYAIQQIDLIWSKALRGAPGAARRQALPRAFVLAWPPAQANTPSRVLPPLAALIQHHRLDEWDDFRPWVEVQQKTDCPRTVDHLVLRPGPLGLEMGFRGTEQGAPPKRHSQPRVLTLQPGEHGQLLLNWRHTSYSGQCYVETIYNVIWGDAIAPDAFMAAPAKRHDARGHLF